MELTKQIELTEKQLARLHAGKVVSIPATEEEFLEFWPQTPYKAEYHNNHIIIMGLAAFIHEVLVIRVAMLLSGLYSYQKGFFVAGSNVGLKVPLKKGYYNPDVTVVQGKPAYQGNSRAIITNPYILVEVLSESTAHYDLYEKLPRYQRLTSLSIVLFVDYFEKAVLVAQPTATPKVWTMTTYDQPDDLVAIEGQTIPLAEFFANLPEE